MLGNHTMPQGEPGMRSPGGTRQMPCDGPPEASAGPEHAAKSDLEFLSHRRAVRPARWLIKERRCVSLEKIVPAPGYGEGSQDQKHTDQRPVEKDESTDDGGRVRRMVKPAVDGVAVSVVVVCEESATARVRSHSSTSDLFWPEFTETTVGKQRPRALAARALAPSVEAFAALLNVEDLASPSGPATERIGAYSGGTCTRRSGAASLDAPWPDATGKFRVTALRLTTFS